MAQATRVTLLTWCASFVIYLAFAGKLSVAEISVGALVGAATAALLLLVSGKSSHHFQLNLRWLVKLRQVPGQMLLDSVVVYRAILRRPSLARGTGRFQERDFHVGNEHPAARARRALVTYGISCAPNTYVVGAVTSPNERLIVHQLVPEKKRARDREWPI